LNKCKRRELIGATRKSRDNKSLPCLDRQLDLRSGASLVLAYLHLRYLQVCGLFSTAFTIPRNKTSPKREHKPLQFVDDPLWSV
jgi:hypothetical protein